MTTLIQQVRESGANFACVQFLLVRGTSTNLVRASNHYLQG